jgi:hypothetical protein
MGMILKPILKKPCVSVELIIVVWKIRNWCFSVKTVTDMAIQQHFLDRTVISRS